MLVKFINFLHFYNIVYRLFSLKISKTTYIIVKIFRICLHKYSFFHVRLPNFGILAVFAGKRYGIVHMAYSRIVGGNNELKALLLVGHQL